MRLLTQIANGEILVDYFMEGLSAFASEEETSSQEQRRQQPPNSVSGTRSLLYASPDAVVEVSAATATVIARMRRGKVDSNDPARRRDRRRRRRETLPIGFATALFGISSYLFSPTSNS
jgi:hypothetical protein